jgi:hypothetical protein
MNLEQLIDFKKLSEVFLFANTPIYLYTHFRKDASVQNLAKTCSTNELTDCLGSLLTEPVKDLTSAVKAYAVLVSLSLKPAQELGRLKNYTTTNLEWFSRLKSLVFEDAPTTNVITVNIENKPTAHVQGDQGNPPILKTNSIVTLQTTPA